METVIDYIIINSSHYTGGIYWIPGHTKEHVITALEHIKEVRTKQLVYTCSIAEFFVWT